MRRTTYKNSAVSLGKKHCKLLNTGVVLYSINHHKMVKFTRVNLSGQVVSFLEMIRAIMYMLYTGLGRGPYGGRHLGSCPPSRPQFQARGWTSTTFAHCKLTYFIFIIAYDCFRNPSSTKLNIFLYFCLHNVLLIFS